MRSNVEKGSFFEEILKNLVDKFYWKNLQRIKRQLSFRDLTIIGKYISRFILTESTAVQIIIITNKWSLQHK